MIRVYLLAVAVGTSLFAAPAGEEVFKQRCAGCHEQNNTRIPSVEVLHRMPAARILRTLNWGVMGNVAYTMSIAEREAVASYLGTHDPPNPVPPAAFCADRAVRFATDAKAKSQPQWNGWSPSANNTRYQSTQAGGITIDGVQQLKLKWAFAYDGDTTAFAEPTILDGNLFTGSAGGVIHALDAKTGCIRWTYDAKGPVRASIRAVSRGKGYSLLFGDQLGWFYSLDAATGKELWKKKIDEHDAARLTGSPVEYEGTVFVPVASWEENRASSADYPCCTFRGGVAALRVRDGSVVWRTYTVDVPKQTGKLWGPSGAPVWSAPTLDVARGLLYVTTGDNYSPPATATSDAVLALDSKTGKIVWSRQLTPGDIFSGGCSRQEIACGPDFDFGSSAILVHSGNRDILLAGQKSGIVYGLDPMRKGEILWQIRVGKGSTNGGVQWGMAADGQNVYAAVSDLARARVQSNDPADLRTSNLDPNEGGGLYAIRIADGIKAWYAEPQHTCPAERPGCSPAQPAAVTVTPGIVFSGSVDGHMRAYSSEDGTILWDFDTAREYATVNGVKGRGGSIDGPGAVVVGGMVYVNSGYSRQNGTPGNVLLAFGTD
ncbi:MAG: PQQ-binding-like beta-propeller repeat protein [Acidobacteriia bacterium]|nr:PQQ-binding-like beta-propeller repeat protein [Terriglobia bacterium]